MSKIYFKGFNSCVMRKKELLHYQRFAAANGHAVLEAPEGAEYIVLWSCAFRSDVAQNSVLEAMNYQRKFPGAKIVLCGCLPDIIETMIPADFRGAVVAWKDTETFLERTLGNKPSFASQEPVFVQPALCGDAAEYRRLHPESNATFHDQFIKVLISEGCPFACTYCSEILTLPPHRSVPAAALIESLRPQLAGARARDLILLSDCLGEYGSDIGSSLPELIRQLRAEFPGLGFALHNLHPASFMRHFDALAGFVRDGWLSHVNLPIQSASDRILAAMKRNYTKADLGRILNTFKDLGFSKFDTHIIVGFPGETAADFRETLDFILEHNVRYVLASSFFCVPRTPAAKMPDQVPEELKSERCLLAKKTFEEAGIICNIENSGLATERLRRINASTQL